MRKNLILLFLLVGTFAHAQYNPYINKVYEYRPAPGQFVNELPEWEEGDDANDMRLKAEESIANHEQVLISLGGWGGYVVFGFDHMIPNFMGEYDIKILGNAFYASANPSDTLALGGSAEPGIVMVSFDANGNGRPDDEWYELAGSEYHNPATIHDYTCTYHRPDANHVATPNKEYPYLTDTTYIRWNDNHGNRGYISRNSYHKQNYWPEWLDTDSLVYSGSRLRNNGIDESGIGQYYVLYTFDWGYADNQPNKAGYTGTEADVDAKVPHVSEFDIDWAVDKDGKKVWLPGIHFVKVYTGVNQYNGWLGEASTEIIDAWDLHMLDADGNDLTMGIKANDNDCVTDVEAIYSLDGKKVTEFSRPGIYIMKSSNGTRKIMKQ